MYKSVDLIGDGIENPFNAKTLIDVAQMFASTCLFRDRKDLAQSMRKISQIDDHLKLISCEEIVAQYSSIMALENLDDAHEIYGFRPPSNGRHVLIAGNEKFGIAQDMRQIATHVLQIPMPGATLNTLNVAAAAGVALYYLSVGTGNKLHTRTNPEKRRPEVLFMGVQDHIELGSAIRSAGAFGWSKLFLEDREGVWFGCNRVKRSEGRAAARRGRNSIRLIPVQKTNRFVYKEVLVISSKEGIPLHQAKLTGGPQQLLVVPDESQINFASENWDRLGSHVQFVQIRPPNAEYIYHYRLFASIALAEAARHLGDRSATLKGKTGRQRLIYDNSIDSVSGPMGEEVFLEDLEEY